MHILSIVVAHAGYVTFGTCQFQYKGVDNIGTWRLRYIWDQYPYTWFFQYNFVIKLKLWPMTQLPFVGLVAVNGADDSMCSWVFSEASLHQQILRHQTLTVHRSLARYTCRPTQSAATSSLLNANFTHACPYSRHRRLKQSTHCTAEKLAQWLLFVLFLLPVPYLPLFVSLFTLLCLLLDL